MGLMRVLELSSEEGAAAFCGRAFIHSGAEVIKVECPDRGPVWEPADVYLNSGKRRVALDYRDAEQRAAIGRIARWCQVIVTDTTARDVETFELLALGGAEPLHISITPFGLSGPYRDWSATDATLLALSGHTWLAGDPGRAPLTMPWRYPQYQAGQFAYIAARSEALRVAAGTRPRSVEVSMHECLVGLHQSTDTMWTSEHRLRSRNGNSFHHGAPMFLPCHDGWYELSGGQAFWVAFTAMIDRPDLADDPRFAALGSRLQHQAELAQLTTEALMGWSVERIMREGQEVWRVPVGYLATLGSLLEDEQLAHADFWRPVPGRPGLKLPGSPVRLAAEQRPLEPAAILPGTDTQAVLAAMPPAAEHSRPGPPPKVGENLPLAGIRILDLTRVWAGPLATRILGDLGADIIKIEAPSGRGPATTQNNQTPRHWNQQALFNKLNRNKRSVALDLKQERGRSLFLALVAEADAVIENFAPRAMPALGLDYAALHSMNDKLIYLAMPAYGLSGPRRDYIGFGSSIEPSSGFTAIMGYSAEEPRVTLAGVTDAMAGTLAAGALLDAIHRRTQTGKGELIELSQQQAGIAFIGEYLVERQLRGCEPERLGNGHRSFAPHGVYRCRGDDKWISLAARDEREWLALCAVADRGWECDARFDCIESRRSHRNLLDATVEAWTTGYDPWYLARLLQERGVPAGPVLHAAEWLDDEHLAARRYFVELDHAEAGYGRWDGSPLRFKGDPETRHWRAAPMLGEDNAAVLGGILGIDPMELELLEGTGVITDHPPS